MPMRMATGGSNEIERLQSAAYWLRRRYRCMPTRALLQTVGAVAAIPQIVELNIGHFLIGASVFRPAGSHCRCAAACRLGADREGS